MTTKAPETPAPAAAEGAPDTSNFLNELGSALINSMVGGAKNEGVSEPLPDETKATPDLKATPDPKTAPDPKATPKDETEDTEDAETAGLTPRVIRIIARRKLKAAKEREAKANEILSRLESAKEDFEKRAVHYKNDVVSAWDDHCKAAGLDPLKAFEALAKAKIGKKPPEESPETANLRKEVEEIKESKKQEAKAAQVAQLRSAMVKDHQSVAALLNSDAYPYASSELPTDVDGVIQEMVTTYYANPGKYPDLTHDKVAKAVDKYFKIRHDEREARRAKTPVAAGQAEEKASKPTTDARPASPAGVPRAADFTDTSAQGEMSETAYRRALGAAVLGSIG